MRKGKENYSLNHGQLQPLNVKSKKRLLNVTRQMSRFHECSIKLFNRHQQSKKRIGIINRQTDYTTKL